MEIKEKYTENKIEMMIKSSIESEKEAKEMCRKDVELYKEKNMEVIAQNVEMKRKIS